MTGWLTAECSLCTLFLISDLQDPDCAETGTRPCKFFSGHGASYMLVITSCSDALCEVLNSAVQENNYRMLVVLILALRREYKCCLCNSRQSFLTGFAAIVG